MMNKRQHSITALPMSPEEERRLRMVKYSIAMGIRMICIFAMLFVSGWWLVLCATLAIVLPYFAMIIANVKMTSPGNTVLRPSAIVHVKDTHR